jgi:hypothetical protein
MPVGQELRIKISRVSYFIALAVAALASLQFLTACGNAKMGDAGPNPNPQPGPTPVTTDIRQCTVGQIFNPQYGCLNQAGCPSGQGLVTTTNPAQCVSGTLVTQQTAYGTSMPTRFFGSMSGINTSNFNRLLQIAGLCDFYQPIPIFGFNIGGNFGTYSCSNYSFAGFVYLFVAGSTITPGQEIPSSVTVGAGRSAPSNWTEYQSIFTAGTFLQFERPGKTVLYNDHGGLQVIASNNWGQGDFRIYIDTGSLNSSSMVGRVVHQGNVIATVNFQKY